MRHQVIGVEIPTVYSPVSATNIISVTGENSNDRKISADGRKMTFWSSSYGTGTGTMTVKLRTYIVNAPNTTSEYLSISFIPAVFSYKDNKFYGPNNSVAGSAATMVPNTLTALSTPPTVKNPAYAPYVNFTVNKTGANAPLAGATFTLTGGPTTNIPAVTTLSDGKATFTNILAGTYTLTETVVPAGYSGVSPQQITISATNNQITINNVQKTVNIKIIAKDQNNNAIVGANYSVTNTATNQVIGTYTTGNDGTVTTAQLVQGQSYTITQNTVPNTYLATATSPQTVANIGYETRDVTFTNTLKTYSTVNINLKKTGTTTNLAGGTFELWTTGANPTRVQGPVTTDANGNTSFTNVLNGTVYEVRQIAAPTNYLTAAPQEVNLSNVTATSTQNLQFYNSDVQLTVNLKAQSTTTNLSGAQFVAKQGGAIVSGPATTGADGNAILTGLQIGQTYTIEEVKAPVGYMPRTPDTVTITSQSQWMNVTNVPLELTVTLTSPYNEAIAGTEFALKDSTGATVATGTTDVNGKISWKGAPLIYGETYTIEQTTVEDGFKKADPVSVTISKALTEVAITNGQFASLNITLFESFTTTPLPGGTFVVKDENYNIIGGPKTTGADGKVSFTGLEDGKTYIIEQTAAPDGYIPIEPKTYLQDGLTYNQPIFNTKGVANVSSLKITVEKSDDPTVKLAGAQFKVTGPNGAVYNVTTNSDGVAILTNLPNGDYTITQTSAPTGYLPESTVVSRSLTNQAGDLTVKNVYVGEEAGALVPGIIKATIYESDVNGVPTGRTIEGDTIRATDNLGNVYYATSNANGVLYLSGLNVLRTYDLEVVDAPYQYGNTDNWPGAQLDLGFGDLTTPMYRETLFYINQVPTNILYINVLEKGDARVKIEGAQVELTYPDGTKEIFTTNADGAIEVPGLPRDFEYTVRQISTDTDHNIDPVSQTIYLLRPETVDFFNPLKDPGSEIRDITVTKEWGDPTPSGLSSLEFTLYENGVNSGVKRTLTGTTGSVVFEGRPKYDSSHGMINYTVVETPIPNYYAVYEKKDSDGYLWTVTNYEGSMTGVCTSGVYWMSNSATAYQYNPDGTKTNRYITLGGTFGYAIAMTPVAMADGKQYLFGMDVSGYLTMHDLSKPQDQTFVGTSTSRLVTGYSSNSLDYANTMGISNDGKWLFAGGEGDQTIKIFSTQAVIDAMKSGSSLPGPVSTISVNGLTAASGFAGDIIQLPNGDLLASINNNGNKGYGSGLVIFQKTGEGTWANPKKVGNISFPQSGSDERIEALALVYPNGAAGNPVVVISQLATPTEYRNYILDSIPTYNVSKTYSLTPWGTSADWPGGTKYADATSGSMTPCDVSIKVPGQKVWVGDTPEDRPREITVELLRNGQPLSPSITETVTAGDLGNWLFEFTNLPKYDSSGVRYRYSVREVGSPPGYVTTNPPADPGTGGTMNTTISNKLLTTEINLIKVDKDKNPLTGAKFTLYGATTATPPQPDLGKVIQGPLGVGSDGKLTISGLRFGTYFLKETTPPPGYPLTDTLYRVEVTQSGISLVTRLYKVGNPDVLMTVSSNTAAYEIINEKAVGSFDLKKVDQTGAVLPGAEFTLMQGTNEIKRATVDNNTSLIMFDNLVPGDYVLTETKTPDGYLTNDNIYYVNVNAQGVVTIRLNDPVNGPILPHDPQLVIANYLKGSLVVKKVDESGNAVIPGDGTNGAQFTLTGTSLSYELVVTVGTDGLATFDNLLPGTYTLKETRPPEGYTGDPNTYIVTVADDGQVTVTLGEQVLPQPLLIKNKKSKQSFTIKKVKEDGTTQILEGVQFTLYQSDKTTPVPTIYAEDGTTVIANYTNVEAGTDGLFHFTHLDPTKTYYLKETKTIAGYVLDQNFYEIKFKTDGSLDVPTGGGILFLENGQWTFKNYPVGEYPATGGMGTLPYLMLGAGLMAAAFTIRKKGLRGGDRST